jgi:hypothetical protein
MTMVLISAGCIKETYDMNRFSDKIHYSPTLAIAAVKGDITLSDMVKSNDTIIFDNDNFIRIILRQDSVINLKLKDYYDFNNMVSFSKGYVMGELRLDDFQATIPISLDVISSSFTPALRAQFVARNHLTLPFPPFPQTDIGEKSFSVFTNFQSAVFSSGVLEISVKNNMPVQLNNIKIKLYNSVGHSQIGNEMIIPAISPGATQSATLDLSGKTVTNALIAAVVLTGSPGTSNPVLIDLNNTIQVGLYAYNLKIQSGKIIVPQQTLSSLDNKDTVSFDPGSGVEIEKFKVLSGNINYHIISKCNISSSFTVTLPTALQGSTPISKSIQINPNANLTGNISVDNTEFDLSTYPSQKFNKLPVDYSISISSTGTLIEFNKTDSIHLDIEMLSPDFDYIKGYFGKRSEQIDPDSLSTDLDEILDHITGQFHISNPSIKVNYSNSFGIPIEVTLNASGKKNLQTVNLGLAPFTIAYPTLATRDVTSSFAINKSNSSLPDLVSLPPSIIRFSGSAKMNPQGSVGGRNNYIFGNSRFLASLEVEVPMELWIKNLQFSDTVDNFLDTGGSDNNSFKPEDIDSLRMNISVQNGFPFGVSLKMMLYDSVKKVVLKTIDSTDILKPAPVDAKGVVSGITESTASIEFTKEFFEAIKEADKIIFVFTLNTSDGGTKDVKIYSNYSISFKASVVVKPNFYFK